MYRYWFSIHCFWRLCKICGGWLYFDACVLYNPVFDSYWKKKSLYPLCLPGCSDFFRCFEL